jgi:hypothetical protein
MAVGKISFGFSGPADANSFDLITNLPQYNHYQSTT